MMTIDLTVRKAWVKMPAYRGVICDLELPGTPISLLNNEPVDGLSLFGLYPRDRIKLANNERRLV